MLREIALWVKVNCDHFIFDTKLMTQICKRRCLTYSAFVVKKCAAMRFTHLNNHRPYLFKRQGIGSRF
ncbi:hypothetical protein HMPREF3171_09095 [Corynebacterium sp. HMSC08F01]|nr:hypothetical protein HMPREF3171_09095 [Corynebacterium sp. HMSC08F01]